MVALALAAPCAKRHDRNDHARGVNPDCDQPLPIAARRPIGQEDRAGDSNQQCESDRKHQRDRVHGAEQAGTPGRALLQLAGKVRRRARRRSRRRSRRGLRERREGRGRGRVRRLPLRQPQHLH